MAPQLHIFLRKEKQKIILFTQRKIAANRPRVKPMLTIFTIVIAVENISIVHTHIIVHNKATEIKILYLIKHIASLLLVRQLPKASSVLYIYTIVA